MNKRLKALHDKLQALIDRKQELLAKDEWTDEERAEVDALPEQMADIKRQIEGVEKLDAAGADANAFLNGSQAEMVAVGAGAGVAGSGAGTQIPQPRTVPGAFASPTAPAVRVPRGRAKNFSGATQAEKNLKAYRFGMFLLATIGNNQGARTWCAQNGIPIERGFAEASGHVESINEDGGFLVPIEFDDDLIDLREKFGVFRQFSKRKPMSREQRSIMRRREGLEAYFEGEAEAANDSKKKWDRVNLVARKLMALAYYSTELSEDAILDVGDDLASEIAYAFAKKEDNCGFNGDGTEPFGGIVGVRAKLRAVDAAISNIKGLQVASGNTWDEYELEDFNFLVGRLPQYADNENTAFYCHKRFYHGVMERLMLGAGGVTAAEVAAGRRTPMFMGYPVRISQAMPSTEANSQIECIFGDLSLGTTFGDRRGTTIAMSEHAEFVKDQLVIRGTERFDINVHDVGNTVDAGPLVGLISAAG